ncbi:hypothetical protein AUR04nite_10520 [Glutamicibacter uratoxydans]|uniref:DUF4194 domain-containing protein n=1 Tax=Glutamicibacter uratoxydans TaxID=43667 RepID=A0A4Y4DPP9_GLUUR|nr:DUF4194 domain-containing protein [Glutamicibacter uratoxydans]GED05520.1 hypothetical protein AUR04nite_10520 [Glutamicibacter uratoxydans]
MTDILRDNADDGTGEDALRFLDALDEPAPNLEDEGEEVSLAMFEGDTGTLYPEQRRCLHALLKQRYISADRHPEQWATLVADQDLIKSRLNDLYLELHIDRGYQVAFKRQARTETGDRLPSLLNDLAHQKEETIVMMHLRQRFFAQRQENDDAVFVDRQSLLDEVAGQRPEHATDRAMDQKRADKAIENLNTAGVLLKTGDPDRFRISPIIEVLMPIEKLRALLAWFMTQNSTDVGERDDDALDGDDRPDQLFEMEERE